MTSRLPNILLDLGGVIIDLDRARCEAEFRRLGMPDPAAFIGEYSQRGPFGSLEAGQISVAEFFDQVRACIPRPVTDVEVERAFNSFLLDLPVRRLRAIDSLRASGHRVCLLSNTNPVMWHTRIADLFRADGRERDDYFDGIVTSFEARCMKPDPHIFRLCASRLGLDPASTLFLDDSTANVEAARAMGFRAEQVLPGTEFETYIPRFQS